MPESSSSNYLFWKTQLLPFWSG
ncbi:hypothetical protein RDI58_026674 [Solanum bulbocastanum]|uniref:Uncharacterized protein n=1 Tax=Solanum bulbocastanum TaxID=147425 RepID=A0AAN8T0M6_SOLBU